VCCNVTTLKYSFLVHPVHSVWQVYAFVLLCNFVSINVVLHLWLVVLAGFDASMQCFLLAVYLMV